MNRRSLLKTGFGAASVGLMGCSPQAPAATPRHEMPMESDPHVRTLMQWPVRVDVYGARDLVAVQDAIVRLANAISEFEPVALMAAPGARGFEPNRLSAQVEHWDIPTDDLWCRDSGPTFVRGSDGGLAVAHLEFNGWGDKQPHANDARVAPRVAERLGLELLPTGLIGEQGGVEHDGHGTLLAHASCWVNDNRNPGLSEAEIGERLMQALGGQTMIWAPGIIGADITDYHIDALARFVGPGHVLVQMDELVNPDDPWSIAAHETLAILQRSTDAAGRPLQISRLPEAVDIRGRGDDFVASYVNYYVCNGAVILADFGDRRADDNARGVLAELYPGRRIVQLNVDAIGASGGGIHCATQQQPA
ncbi:MAG: agmatine deiminase family protein [Caulobacterales bacterium]|nr:agmatine deiminase family protein [Caulobacterales bacterium]